jgi:hypothetical protein
LVLTALFFLEMSVPVLALFDSQLSLDVVELRDATKDSVFTLDLVAVKLNSELSEILKVVPQVSHLLDGESSTAVVFLDFEWVKVFKHVVRSASVQVW